MMSFCASAGGIARCRRRYSTPAPGPDAWAVARLLRSGLKAILCTHSSEAFRGFDGRSPAAGASGRGTASVPGGLEEVHPGGVVDARGVFGMPF